MKNQLQAAPRPSIRSLRKLQKREQMERWSCWEKDAREAASAGISERDRLLGRRLLKNIATWRRELGIK